MMRGVMEAIFRSQQLDEIFEFHGRVQYTRDLLFASLVNLLSLVVGGKLNNTWTGILPNNLWAKM